MSTRAERAARIVRGRDLAAARIAAGRHRHEIAAETGVSVMRVLTIEWEFGRPTDAWVARYFAALARLSAQPRCRYLREAPRARV